MNISMERDVVHKDLIIITSGVFNSLLQLLMMAQYIFTVVRVRVASIDWTWILTTNIFQPDACFCVLNDH